MVCTYVFVPGVNSDIFILFTYDRVMLFTGWGFWTYTYTQILPCLHIVIIGNTPYLIKSKECQGPEFL